MAIPTPITPLPIPQRGEDANDFNVKMNGFVSGLSNDAIPGINLHTTFINEESANVDSAATAAALSETNANNHASTAADSAQLAASNANFKGLWASQSGSASIPYSVYHNNSYYQLVVNIPNVAASEPTPTSNDWRIAGVDDEVNLIAKSSGGKLIGHRDLNGNVNLFYRIPVFSYEDIGMSGKMGAGVVSAFLKPNGIDFYSELLVAVVPMSLVGTDAVSIPGLEPLHSKTFDEMRAYAVSAGYHLMTSHDWAAVALWCEANGLQPKGNTNYARSYDDLKLNAVRSDGLLPGDTGGAARTLGASGPCEWNHNGYDFGISDLVGNVWEWVDGFKISNGQVIASEFNLDDESAWVAQACFFDAGNKLNSSKTADLTNGSVTWSAIGKDASYASNQLMKRMMIEPDDATTLVGRCYYNNTGERSPRRGGGWGSGSHAGLGALYLSDARSYGIGGVSGRFALLR